MEDNKPNNQTLLVIPTYNESENIDRLIAAIRAQPIKLDILFIDDNSPDGTADLIRTYQKTDSSIHLLTRPGKMGLGSAYVLGFKYGLDKKFSFIMEMDADLSHDPAEIPRFHEAILSVDVVLGSRYIEGVNVVNWPLKRLILSYAANIYASVILGFKLKDSTGGYKLFRREVLEEINLDKIKSNGYSFQIETTYRAFCKGFKVKEISIVFTDRMAGHSKMSRKIVYEAILMVWKLKFRHMLGRI